MRRLLLILVAIAVVTGGMSATASFRQGLKNGLDALRMGSYDEAARVFDRVAMDGVSNARTVAESRLLRGSAKLRLGDVQQAKLDFATALQTGHDGNRAWALSEQCWIHWREGRAAAAVAAAAEAIALRPNLANAYKCRGYVMKQAGRYPQALRDYNRLLALPRLPERARARALAQRGDVHYRRGDFRAAGRDFSLGLRLQPGDAGLLTARCRARAFGGLAAAAIEDCRQALAHDPEHPVARDSLGLAYLFAGSARPALAAFESLIETRPDAWYAHFHRALALEELGRATEAAEARAAARRLAPSARAYDKKERKFRAREAV